jgi:anti-sigma B factor antagonist
MKVSARHQGGVTIVEIKGKVVHPHGPVALYDAVKEALGAGSQAILVDLEKASVLDSAGIGELVHAFTSTANRGGQLKLLKPSPKALNILEITRLPQVLEIYYDEAEAIESFTALPVGAND